MSKGIRDDEILEVVQAHEPAATTEIAESLGIARQSAHYRLDQLEEEGRVRSKKVGPSVVWMLDK